MSTSASASTSVQHTPLSEARRLLRHDSKSRLHRQPTTSETPSNKTPPTHNHANSNGGTAPGTGTTTPHMLEKHHTEIELLRDKHINGSGYGSISDSSSLLNIPFSATAPSLLAPRSRRSSTHTMIPHDPNRAAWKSDLLFFSIMFRESPLLTCMILAIPFGLLVHFTKWSPSISFILNFIGIIPLAWLLGNATEELALRTTQTLGGLLNATFGNAVELIVSIVALRRGLISLVQTSLLGSILSNMLLVLGMSFFIGGLRYPSQVYNRRGAHMYSSMLLLACVALALPTCFMHSFAETPSNEHLLDVSRATACIMFFCYLLYLFFQLYTHASIFDDINLIDIDMENGLENGIDEDETVDLQLSAVSSLTLLTVVTILVSLCSDGLVASIEGFTQAWNINPSFVGLILIPIVGNAAEHATAVRVAMKDKLDLSIGVAIGSSTQIALFLIPFLTLLGWGLGQPMSLDFNPFESVVMVMSVLIVNFVVKDGTANWLEGVLLIAAYLIIAVMFWFHPTQ